MVFYNQTADDDLTNNILIGLISWKKHPLEREHAIEYVQDIVAACNTLDTKSIHFNATYKLHRRYGKKVHRYRRGGTTQWNNYL